MIASWITSWLAALGVFPVGSEDYTGGYTHSLWFAPNGMRVETLQFRWVTLTNETCVLFQTIGLRLYQCIIPYSKIAKDGDYTVEEARVAYRPSGDCVLKFSRDGRTACMYDKRIHAPKTPAPSATALFTANGATENYNRPRVITKMFGGLFTDFVN